MRSILLLLLTLTSSPAIAIVVDGEGVSFQKGQNQPWHGCCSLEYYQEALSLMSSDLPVIIFSDDPEWALSQELFESDRFYVSQGNSNLFDMCLMTLCDHHIIANSSFSWWGAWLNQNPEKIVIAPKKWYANVQSQNPDIIPSSWLTF